MSVCPVQKWNGRDGFARWRNGFALQSRCRRPVLFSSSDRREPLLFPDLKTLYLELRNMGMILTINTNGTLLGESWAFCPYPPRRINITLYGADAQHLRPSVPFPQGFDQTLRAVRLLRARNVDVKISCSVTKKNPQDFSRILPSDKSSVSLSTPITI